MIKFLILFGLFCATSLTIRSQENLVEGRFIAFDRFAPLGNPREPTQLLILEEANGSEAIIKTIYFPKTNGLRGGAQFLLPADLKYQKVWKLRLREPMKEEKRLCKVDSFFRSADGGIDLDANQEPVLRFRSTLFESDLKLDRLSSIPCLVIEEIIRG